MVIDDAGNEPQLLGMKAACRSGMLPARRRDSAGMIAPTARRYRRRNVRIRFRSVWAHPQRAQGVA